MKTLKVTFVLVCALFCNTLKSQTLDIDRTSMVCGSLEMVLYAIDPITCSVVGSSSTITIPFGSTTISYSTTALAALFPPLPPGWEIGAADIFTPVSCTLIPTGGSSCPDDFMNLGNSSCSYSATACMISTPNPCGSCVSGVQTQASFTSGTAAVITLY